MATDDTFADMNDSNLVPEGYWELLTAWMKKQPRLPDDEFSLDLPEPFI